MAGAQNMATETTKVSLWSKWEKLGNRIRNEALMKMNRSLRGSFFFLCRITRERMKETNRLYNYIIM